ncbi:hypothetical protein O999_10840 [Pseudomonas putida LF54]|nr:hypothetical protein O999_10840 [Pseudomonas putida LF54]
MAKGLSEMIMPDDPRMLEAVGAMRRYHETRASGRADMEVERLRILAEFLFQAIADHNVHVLGLPTGPQH